MDDNLSAYYSPHDLIFIQSRAKTSQEIIKEYARKMKCGVKFDAVSAFRDSDGTIFVWDGYHRGEAAKMAGMQLLVEFRPGTRRDAEWEALGANQRHGLQRTWEDEDKVVREALLHFPEHSIRKIYEHTGVDRRRIARLRDELIADGQLANNETEVVVERKGQVYRQKVHRKNDKVSSSTIEPKTKKRSGMNDQPPVKETELPPSQPFYFENSDEITCPICSQSLRLLNEWLWCMNCNSKWPDLETVERTRHNRLSSPQSTFESVSQLKTSAEDDQRRAQAVDLATEVVKNLSGIDITRFMKYIQSFTPNNGVKIAPRLNGHLNGK